MLKIEEIKDRTVLLDTNILINYAVDGFKERSANPLRSLVDNGNNLLVSPLTGFEVLMGNKESSREKYLKFLNYLPSISMERVYFNNAALLSDDYRKICNRKKVPNIDLLLGSIVVTHSFSEDKMLFMTTDRVDFCEPIWLTVAHKMVNGTDGNQQINLYILEVNTQILLGTEG